jgi:hypothetical protein
MEEKVAELSLADHSVSPPQITIPREYNAAHDLIERNLRAGRSDKVAFIDDAASCTYGRLAQRVDAFAHGLTGLTPLPGKRRSGRIYCRSIPRESDSSTRSRSRRMAGLMPIRIRAASSTCT